MRMRVRTLLLALLVACSASWEPCDKSNDYCGDPEEFYDSDGDGYEDYAYSGEDCDDLDASVYPGAPPSCDGVTFDADCDGVQDILKCDIDGDGVTPEDGDCNDYDVDTYAGAPELCDAVDQDCDGVGDATEPDCVGSDLDDTDSGDTASDTGSDDTGG